MYDRQHRNRQSSAGQKAAAVDALATAASHG
jgi:hypothetical protein